MKPHSAFQELLVKMKGSPALSQHRAGAVITSSFDLDADGTIDARLIEGRSGDASVQELSVLDAEGWPERTFLRRQPGLSLLAER